MKKIIAMILMLTLCVSMLAACGQKDEKPADENTDAPAAEQTDKDTTEEKEEAPDTSAEDLAAAKEYLSTMYKKAPSTHTADFEVVGKVVIGTASYDIEWTADSDTVKFVKGDNGMVTVDIDEQNPEEVKFVLTGTITDANGNKESVSLDKKVPAAIIITEDMTDEDIVAAVYKMDSGMEMGEEITLTGKIVKIDSPYNPEYKNLSVIMQVGELAEQPILCFRLGGEGADTLKEGDEITVKGIIKNYKGTIEFDAGCALVPKA